SAPSLFHQLIFHAPSAVFQRPPIPEIYTLSLHDALPISAEGPVRPPSVLLHGLARQCSCTRPCHCLAVPRRSMSPSAASRLRSRSEEHTSELQSHLNIVCRLLLEKKKTYTYMRLLHTVSD